MGDAVSGKQVILCIDDEQSILKSLERCFLSAGYLVLKAESGAEALKILEQNAGKVDLIIVDQRMPQMTGDAFLKAAREKYGRFTAIMLSGYADFESLVSAVNDGEIARFVSKPWNNQELLETVKTILHRSAGQVK